MEKNINFLYFKSFKIKMNDQSEYENYFKDR